MASKDVFELARELGDLLEAARYDKDWRPWEPVMSAERAEELVAEIREGRDAR